MPESQRDSSYMKYKKALDQLWKLLRNQSKLEIELEKMPDKLRERLYKHPLVNAYDLLP